MNLAVYIFLGSFFGILTAFVGGQRGYSLILMYLTGFVSGPLGVGIAFLLPNRSEDAESTRTEVEGKTAQASHVAA